jgi:hypothetical protein
MVEDDNETWLIDSGHAIIEKKAAVGVAALTPRERLIHCFWITDYSMRNAGDLAAARDLDPRYQTDAVAAATALGLSRTAAIFSLSEGELERRFFGLFDDLCAELRG